MGKILRKDLWSSESTGKSAVIPTRDIHEYQTPRSKRASPAPRGCCIPMGSDAFNTIPTSVSNWLCSRREFRDGRRGRYWIPWRSLRWRMRSTAFLNSGLIVFGVGYFQETRNFPSPDSVCRTVTKRAKQSGYDVRVQIITQCLGMPKNLDRKRISTFRKEQKEFWPRPCTTSIDFEIFWNAAG